MMYQDRLKKWAIVRIEKSQRTVVDRFRSFSDAEGHLKVLRQRMPNDHLAIQFERPPEDTHS